MTTTEISNSDIDREMMDNSELYVQGRFAQMILQDVGKESRAFYDAAQLRAAFRAGYDYSRRDRRAAGGEAVAWRWKWGANGDWQYGSDRPNHDNPRSPYFGKLAAVEPLYLHPPHSGMAVKAVTDAIELYLRNMSAAHEEGFVTSGSYFSTTEHLVEFVRAELLHPSPDTGKSQDEEGTWSDGGKKWTPAVEEVASAAARITELEEALRRIGEIEFPPTETYYALKATIDYARDQARAAVGDAS